jgi:cbb3-type cytochrome oxidase subunit 3
MTTAEILEWYATIAGVIAALMLAGDFGRKITGFGFILFCTMNIAWILFARMDDTGGLMWQNIILFGVNLIGVWQYLLSPKNRRKMRVAKEAVKEFEEQEGRREAAA